MESGLSESIALIAQIEAHFANKGWTPLGVVILNGLRSLSLPKLRTLKPKVVGASHRLFALMAILEAAWPGDYPKPAQTDELSDSGLLRLRIRKPE